MSEQDDMLERYMRDINHYPLISAEKEKELANIIHNKSSTEKEKLSAKNELVLSNLKLVVKIAISVHQKMQFFPDSNLSLMDLIQAGNIGLMKAAKFFLSEKNYKFSTYAHSTIEREIIISIKESRFIRLPVRHFKHMYDMDMLRKNDSNISDKKIASALHLLENTVQMVKRNRYSRVYEEDMGELLEQIDAHETPIDEVINYKQLKNYLFEKIKELRPRHREAILYMYFSNKNMRLDDVGIKMGISREAVRHLLLRGIHALRVKISDEKTIKRRKNENKK